MQKPKGLGLELMIAAVTLAFVGVLVHASAGATEPDRAAPQQQESVQSAPAGSTDFSPGPRAGN